MKKYILFAVFMLLVKNNLLAASGCLSGGQVYRNPPAGLNSWTSPIQDYCPSGALTSTQYAEVNSISGTTCTIGLFGWGGSGKLVDYDIEFCPIDDYIPLIFVISGVTASYFLRRNFLTA